MIEHARAVTGLTSFGDDPPDEALDALWSSIENEAGLDDAGLAAARAQLTGILCNRLIVAEFLAQNPSITQRSLGSPLVMIGGGARAGTTLLHRLLGADPAVSTMKTWQTMTPVPARGSTRGEPDARFTEAQQRYGSISSPIHPLAADEAEEEVFYLQEALASLLFELQWRLPSYEQWLRTADLEPAYRYMVKLVQLNEWRAGTPEGRPRVMKSPQYSHDLHVVVKHFPDAKIVFCHRDPVRWVGSYVSLFRGTRPGTYPGVDHTERAFERVEMLEYEVRHIASVRATEPSDRFMDVLYADLVADPLAIVRRIYDWTGRPLSREAVDAIEAWLAQNPQGKDGRHAYSLEDFGLDEADIERRFSAYRDAFGIPKENRF